MPHESYRGFSLHPDHQQFRKILSQVITSFLYWLCKMFMLMFTSPKTSVLFEFTESYIN